MSGLLRRWMGAVPLQFFLVALAAAWFLLYWFRSRINWAWREGLPVLLLISISTSWYSWFFDQVVLLPCVFHAAACVIRSGNKAIFFASASFLAINAAVLTLILIHRTTFWYSWTAPAWLLWYLAVRANFWQRAQPG
jgi:hypothetical protein